MRTDLNNHPFRFFGIQTLAWIFCVGNWINIECDTTVGARIAAYTAGLVIFSLVTLVNFILHFDI